MRIAHLADIHYCRERGDEVFASLNCLENYIKKEPVDLIAIAGDIFDAAVLNTGNSGLPEFLEAVRRLGGLAPVAMVYGTPGHDVDSSLEVFEKISTLHGITILEPGQEYFLADGRIRTLKQLAEARIENHRSCVLFGIPEPRKKYLLAVESVGKNETEAAVRDAMRRLCVGLAAKRREYPLPCIVLYHGEVAGCALQNDRAVERGTGIAITADDLRDIGADYYALGHIHKPQQVGNLPAYYAGSIYPKDFGETHKAGFNVVTLQDGKSYVERFDFPHPQNLKIEHRIESAALPPGGVKVFNEKQVKGKRVWLEITCEKSERSYVNDEDLLSAMLARGAAPGSRVTVSAIPTETVRAAEITTVNTPVKKFEVWAENSNIKTTPALLDKIKALEIEAEACGAKPNGDWELVSVKLRGAIGIKKGIGRDEVAISLDDYDTGLIALTGANGKGKTTLIENCHPYPQLLTRKGKLQDHFFLKDSIREVVYRNNADGAAFKFLIQIDGQNKSGACRYFIFRQTAGLAGPEWEPLPGVDGNLKPYEEALTAAFGPIELFLRTAFITQRPTKNLPDLTDATAGDKKALFAELSGIGYLQNFSVIASENFKRENQNAHDAEIKSAVLRGIVNGKDAAETAVKEAGTALAKAGAELAAVTDEGKTAAAELEHCREAWNAELSRKEKETQAAKTVEAYKLELGGIEAAIADAEKAAGNRELYEREIAKWEALQKEFDAENAKKQRILEENLRKEREYAQKKAAFDAKVKELEIKKYKKESLIAQNEAEISGLTSEIKLLEEGAQEIKETCPACGQKLPPGKISELEEKRGVFVEEIAGRKVAIEEGGIRIAALKSEIGAIGARLAGLVTGEPLPEPPEACGSAVMQELRDKILRIDIAETRKLLAAALSADARLSEYRARFAEKNAALKIALGELAGLALPYEAGEKIRADLDAAQARHSALTERYAAVKADAARAAALIEAAKKTLADIAEREKELADAMKVIEISKSQAADWELLTRAFGKDGIQALELDALAPGISDTANRILESAYGDRFRIEIRTTRMGGTGKKAKQIEDFLIYVIDSGDGEAVLLDDKSGGEAVWIKRAIYDAFAVIRKRNTNFAFLTCFQDETDGALDSAAKTAYCRMLEASRAESKLRHTIIITHSSEVKAMIEQKIDMDGLSGIRPEDNFAGAA